MPLPKRFNERPKEAKFIGNRYLVRSTLGQGNFGMVYLVEDFSQGKALKALKEVPMVPNQPEMIEEAIKESRLMTELCHPHVVGLYDSFFIDSNRFFISMEYCKGGNLDDLIVKATQTNRKFPEFTVVCWLTQLSDALDYLHSRRVLHRDIKAKNVFILDDRADPPVLKLGDFGISRMLNFSSEAASTRIGTPYYIPPEVFTTGQYNNRADMWALGCLFYEVAHLRHPFVPAANLQDLVRKIVSGYIDWSDWPYSQALLLCTQQLLQRDPAERISATKIISSNMVKKHIEAHNGGHSNCGRRETGGREEDDFVVSPVKHQSASYDPYVSFDDSLCSNGSNGSTISTLQANWIKLLRAQQHGEFSSLNETLKPSGH